MNRTELKNYARLIARMGGNVKKGDSVIITAGIEQPEFVETLVRECYLAGAKYVRVEWEHQPLEKLNVRYRPASVLGSVQDWEIERMKHYVDVKPVRIYLTSADPDGLAGVNRDKMMKASQARYKVFKPYSDELENRYKWCIAAVPGRKWAKKVFPDKRVSTATELLWDAILETSRAKGDAIANWEAHNKSFEKRCAYLNGLNIRKLRYSSSNGTDLEVGLIKNSLFLGGGDFTIGGEFFDANIPTEEIYISPMRGQAEGVAFATKPLSYQGELIEEFSVRFEGGRAVEVHAARNEDLLERMIAMDEGAPYLGECAIVPYDSPVNRQGILFYNTLFDENACCHLALGRGFTNCIKDFDRFTLDELREMGVNESQIHVDFMIGAPDLKIIAVTDDGREELIFDGIWKI